MLSGTTKNILFLFFLERVDCKTFEEGEQTHCASTAPSLIQIDDSKWRASRHKAPYIQDGGILRSLPTEQELQGGLNPASANSLIQLRQAHPGTKAKHISSSSWDVYLPTPTPPTSTYTFEIAISHEATIGLHVDEVEFVGEFAALVPPQPGNYCVGSDGNSDRHGFSFDTLVDGNTSTGIACNNPTSVGQVMFKLTAPSASTNLRITYRRPKYAPGWRILRDGVEVLKESSNRGNSEIPTPATYDYTLHEAPSPTLSPTPSPTLSPTPSPSPSPTEA